ncbi:hypothetical protein SAMN04515671_3070 [Nakamurella panacisegetis]|uniref:Uncharacterized protein n=1 Tax=Nakamurella panacisegetis TaxID=1090615 RepID=A0A1H0QGF1_9ACTN|nr:hypothetical protein [Nakamurella panacisegetis]SDP15806.1 hypothetical protein SAMN04515671_3070 [Nakamurella panacisegetis]
MSAAPGQRSRGASGVAWPVTSDHGFRPPRGDLLAALLTVVAGACGLGQLFLSWSSMVTGVGLQATGGGITGWERYQAARTGAALSTSDTVTAYSVIGVALAGAALLLLGLCLLTPIDHRPLGVVALLLSIACLAGAAWWPLHGYQTFNQSVSDLFSHAGLGWYLFLAAGPVGILGSAKAISTG